MWWLTDILNVVLSTQSISDEWREAIIRAIWKRKCDDLTCTDHRDITLLSMPDETCHAPSCITTADPVMQASCSDGQQLITSPPFDCSLKRPANSEKTVLSSQPSLVAFDSVHRYCLSDILRFIAISPKVPRVLEQQLLYTDIFSCVRINNTLSDWFGMLAQRTITHTMVRIQNKHGSSIAHKTPTDTTLPMIASAGSVIYSRLLQPSCPRKIHLQPEREGMVNASRTPPPARDGATSSPMTSNRNWGRPCWRLLTSTSIEAAGGITAAAYVISSISRQEP